MATDPVHYDDKEKAWFFWDETWAYRHGPYGSREEASIECSRYARSLDNYRGCDEEDGV
jgi:hypothetical protein